MARMLYQIAHIVRDKFEWLWQLIERLNAWLFSMRYGRRLRSFSFSEIPENYKLVSFRDVPIEKMVAFFEHQPEEAFTYFRPHAFDARSIQRLQGNRAFLAYVLTDSSNGKIAGYCFNRCFFHGVGFRGMMVGIDYRGNGFGRVMHRSLNELGFGMGLRLFETISKDNVASYRSAISANHVKVVKEMPNNELYLEIIHDQEVVV